MTPHPDLLRLGDEFPDLHRCCTQQCNQGRDCPTRAWKPSDDVAPEQPSRTDVLGIWKGLILAAVMTASAVIVGLGVCEWVRRVGL